MIGAGAYFVRGTVSHKRLRPVAHALDYSVVSMLVDVARIEEVASSMRLFSYNGRNVVSLRDSDFGAGDGTPLYEHARRLFRSGGFEPDTEGTRILLLAYPRVLGYAFNPLSVFFLMAATGRPVAIAYEVSNTFGERKSYVVPAGEPSETGVYSQSCRKELFVSPFAGQSGRYRFHVRGFDGGDLTVGVAYDDGDGPLIKTHFRGTPRLLDDAAIAGQMIRSPLVTFKVMAGIHYEALKLWLKGVPLIGGHRSPRYSASYGEHGSANPTARAPAE